MITLTALTLGIAFLSAAYLARPEPLFASSEGGKRVSSRRRRRRRRQNY